MERNTPSQKEPSIASKGRGAEPLPPNATSHTADDASRALLQYLLTQDDVGGPSESRRSSSASSASGESSAQLANPLSLKSGSITYDLYKWQLAHGGEPPSRATSIASAEHKRTRSLSAGEAEHWDLPLSHEEINRPGGFRRQFMHERDASVVTASFVEFLALYGHFAGGDYPSDSDDESSGPSRGDVGERTRLVARRPPEATASARKAFFLLIKAFVGSGVLFLPRAFYNGGLVFSTVVLLATACLALYSMLLLVAAYERVHCGYGEMGRRLYGPWMERVVLLSIVVSQVGFACAGTIFVATNLRAVFDAATQCTRRFPLWLWVSVQLAALVPLSMVRHIKGLSSFALVADVFIVAGLAYVCAMDVRRLSDLGLAYVRAFNPASYSLLLGSAAYTFEGYALILPIVDSMRSRESFPRILTLVMAICAAVAVAIGALSYAAYGDSVQAIVLLNMPAGEPATLAVQLLYSFAILFTNPLMLFPAIRILDHAIFPRKSGKRSPRVKAMKNLLRTVLSVVVVVVSIFGVEKLDKLIAIIGALACVPISFIYPPLFHLKSAAATARQKAADVVLAVFGAALMAYVLAQSIQAWIHDPESPPIDYCDLANGHAIRP